MYASVEVSLMNRLERSDIHVSSSGATELQVGREMRKLALEYCKMLCMFE
jgi:hypothetical protein